MRTKTTSSLAHKPSFLFQTYRCSQLCTTGEFTGLKCPYPPFSQKGSCQKKTNKSYYLFHMNSLNKISIMSLKRNNNLTHKYDETYDGKQQVLKKHFVQCLFYSNIDEKKKIDSHLGPLCVVCPSLHVCVGFSQVLGFLPHPKDVHESNWCIEIVPECGCECACQGRRSCPGWVPICALSCWERPRAPSTLN